MKTSISMDSTDQKKTKVKLKKFLTRRPTYQAVKDKGYIKDQVFGCSLSSLCQRENTSVPNFVTTCIDHVETTGQICAMYAAGGYTLSSSQSCKAEEARDLVSSPPSVSPLHIPMDPH